MSAGIRTPGVRPTLRVVTALFAAALLGTCAPRPGVLEQARELGVLRVATRNGPTSYYLGAHGPEGPEYALAQGFARLIGVRLEFIVLPSPAAVIEAVARGRAHLGAAGLAVTPEWRQSIAFSRPYQRVKLHLVHRRGALRPVDLSALAGRTVGVPADSAHAYALRTLARQNPKLRFAELPRVDALDLLDRVAEGSLDTTVVDRNEFLLAHPYHPELRIAFNLPTTGELAWALPTDDPMLARQVESYFANLEHETPDIVARFYEPAEHYDHAGARALIADLQDRLPHLRPLFENAARDVHEDWRVLAAIGYQESRWDASAVSRTRVRGIMMLTEDTAAQLGVANRDDPDASIRGGARFLAQMRAQVPARIPEPDRTWLALAAYNLGYAHLEDARVLTQAAGRDPDVWLEVRDFLPRLAQPEWFPHTKHGYARGYEAARFVDNIRSYLDVLEWAIPYSAPGPAPG